MSPVNIVCGNGSRGSGVVSAAICHGHSCQREAEQAKGVAATGNRRWGSRVLSTHLRLRLLPQEEAQRPHTLWVRTEEQNHCAVECYFMKGVRGDQPECRCNSQKP